MSKIFISYRHEDASGQAHRLHDSLKRKTWVHIFIDIEDVRGGELFDDAIRAALDSSDVLLAVIGNNWAGAGGGGDSRLHKQDDYVRLEVATALRRGIPVIPVLVQGASVPRADDLPDDLKPLVLRNALEISNGRWEYDVNRLIKRLRQILPRGFILGRELAAAAACVVVLLSLAAWKVRPYLINEGGAASAADAAADPARTATTNTQLTNTNTSTNTNAEATPATPFTVATPSGIPPPTTVADQNSLAGGGGSTLGSSVAPTLSAPAAGHLRFDRTAFFDAYRQEYGALNSSQTERLTNLLQFIEQDRDLTDLRHAAYILATIKHETADTWHPVSERGTIEYFEGRYGPGTKIGKLLGNTEEGDGERYKGRGYLPITGRAMYRKMSQALGLNKDSDLVLHPDKTLDPPIAYRITSHVMRNGEGTGKKLSD